MDIAVFKKLMSPSVRVVHLLETESTNSYAVANVDEAAVVIADRQSGGRGRMGRSFVSPIGGLYMSIVRYEACGFSAGELTAAAAVAVVRAIENVFGVKTAIKWVNDVYLIDYDRKGITPRSLAAEAATAAGPGLALGYDTGHKKVCGILCESTHSGDGGVKTVVGVGVNLTDCVLLPECAGAVVPSCCEDERMRLAASIYNNYNLLRETGGFFEEYRNNCFTLGKIVEVRCGDAPTYRATAVGLCDDFSLIVQTDDGEKILRFGEVSVVASLR